MNKKEKERTGFIVRNIKTEKRDAQNGGADKMGNVKMISPAVPNENNRLLYQQFLTKAGGVNDADSK